MRQLIRWLPQTHWMLRLDRFGFLSSITNPRTVNRPKRIRIGARTHIGRDARLEVTTPDGRITIGDRVITLDFLHIGAAEHLVIGSNTVLGAYVTILDHDHGIPPGLTSVMDEPLISAPVWIGAGVWIGEKATILKGVTVGDGAVIGANALVTRDVPRGAIVGGVPAQQIGQREVPPETRTDLASGRVYVTPEGVSPQP